MEQLSLSHGCLAAADGTAILLQQPAHCPAVALNTPLSMYLHCRSSQSCSCPCTCTACRVNGASPCPAPTSCYTSSIRCQLTASDGLLPCNTGTALLHAQHPHHAAAAGGRLARLGRRVQHHRHRAQPQHEGKGGCVLSCIHSTGTSSSRVWRGCWAKGGAPWPLQNAALRPVVSVPVRRPPESVPVLPPIVSVFVMIVIVLGAGHVPLPV